MISFIGMHFEVLTIVAMSASSIILVAASLKGWAGIDSL